MTAGAVREQIDADQVRSGRLRGADGELDRLRRRLDGDPRAAESDVRPPLSRRRDARDRAHGDARGDDDPEVEPGRRHELLHDRAVALEPEPVLERAEMAPEGDLVAAELDVAAPAAEAGLDDDRAVPVRYLTAGMQDPRARMRQARALQDLRRQQLVVRGEQRPRAVENDDAACGQRAECPEPVFDAVERVGDVQPAQRDRSRLQQRRRLLRDEDARVDPVRRSRSQGCVRSSAALGDDREQHDLWYRREIAIRGLWEGEDPAAVWCAATDAKRR